MDFKLHYNTPLKLLYDVCPGNIKYTVSYKFQQSLFRYTSNNALGISEPKFTAGRTENFLHYNLM